MNILTAFIAHHQWWGSRHYNTNLTSYIMRRLSEEYRRSASWRRNRNWHHSYFCQSLNSWWWKKVISSTLNTNETIYQGWICIRFISVLQQKYNLFPKRKGNLLHFTSPEKDNSNRKSNAHVVIYDIFWLRMWLLLDNNLAIEYFTLSRRIWRIFFNLLLKEVRKLL